MNQRSQIHEYTHQEVLSTLLFRYARLEKSNPRGSINSVSPSDKSYRIYGNLRHDRSMLIEIHRVAHGVPDSARDPSPCSGGGDIVLVTVPQDIRVLRQDCRSVRECGRLASYDHGDYLPPGSASNPHKLGIPSSEGIGIYLYPVIPDSWTTRRG